MVAVDKKRGLGPSNDAPETVQVEIRAAKIVLDPHGASPAELNGVFVHSAMANHAPYSTASLVGWLARELETHDYRDTRDADAWPWDPSRPVAGQYESWLASRDRLTREVGDAWIARAREHEARIAEQTRHDVAAAVARHAAIEEDGNG